MNKKTKNEQRSIFRFKKFACKSYSAFNSMRRVVNIGVLTACILTAVPMEYIKAQNDSNKNRKKEKHENIELQEIVISTKQSTPTAEKTARTISILTNEEIKNIPAQSVQDLLKHISVLDIRPKGANGVQADISIRGSSKDQILFLLNGVNISNAQIGAYNLDFPVNLSDIERIEVIQGPSGIIYGSGAFAGAVNIITKKEIDYRLYAHAEGGTHKLWGGEARGAIQTNKFTNSMSFSHKSSDGYRENTDYKITNAFYQNRININTKALIDINLGYNEKRYGANGFYTPKFPNQYDHNYRYLATAKGKISNNKVRISPQIYWFKNRDTFELRRGEENGRNNHRMDTYGASSPIAYTTEWGTTSITPEVRREEIMSSNLGKTMHEAHGKYTKYDARTNWSIALSQSVNIAKFEFLAGILFNHNTLEKHKYRFLPSLGISYQADYQWTIYSNWSNSTRIPSFTELWYTTETHQGNSQLKAEVSHAVELGFKYKNNLFSAYMTGFLNYGRNIIDWVKIEKEPNQYIYASWNQTKVNTQGLEMGAKIDLNNIFPSMQPKLKIGVDYTRINQDINNQNQISRFQKNYLRDKVTSYISADILDNLTVSAYYKYQYRMGTYEGWENNQSTTTPYSSFSTVDLKVAYTYQYCTFTLNVNNVFDNKAVEIDNIPQAGFWLIGGFSYRLR